MMGALFEFISSASPKHFQPMPPNFGILPELGERIKNKQQRYGMYRDRALADLASWKAGLSLEFAEVHSLSLPFTGLTSAGN
jgi:methylenetetrahydrofolate--tRNA-(uracil-5-)-methyltransferase